MEEMIEGLNREILETCGRKPTEVEMAIARLAYNTGKADGLKQGLKNMLNTGRIES